MHSAVSVLLNAHCIKVGLLLCYTAAGQPCSCKGSVQRALGEMTGRTTVPRVFIDGSFFADGDGTARAARDGSLQQALQKAGAI